MLERAKRNERIKSVQHKEEEYQSSGTKPETTLSWQEPTLITVVEEEQVEEEEPQVDRKAEAEDLRVERLQVPRPRAMLL